MNVIDLEILIPASPDFIWRYLGDLSTAAQWHEGVASLSFLTTQREGRGTRCRYSTAKGNDVVVEVAAWYDTLGYEYTIVDGAGIGDNQGRIRLQEVPEGTLVRWTFNYESGGVLGGLRNTMRLKRSTTKQIQDSLRNLHKLVQQESGGIATHEARASVREAPDADERSSYQPRYPSAFIDPATTDAPSMPKRAIHQPVAFDLEFEPVATAVIPEGDTKPNPVVQVGNDILEAEMAEIDEEDATQPIEMEFIAYEPAASAEAVEEISQPALTHSPAMVESKAGTEAVGSPDRALDSATVSVFEIFGLRKPSEGEQQIVDDRSSADEAFKKMDDLTALFSRDVYSRDDNDQSAGPSPDRGEGREVQISGLRRLTRRRRHIVRSHNL